jgi:hypothetical protein
MDLRSRLEKQPTDFRQSTSYFGDRTLALLRPSDMNVCAGPYPAPADLQLADAPKSLNAG